MRLKFTIACFLITSLGFAQAGFNRVYQNLGGYFDSYLHHYGGDTLCVVSNSPFQANYLCQSFLDTNGRLLSKDSLHRPYILDNLGRIVKFYEGHYYAAFYNYAGHNDSAHTEVLKLDARLNLLKSYRFRFQDSLIPRFTHLEISHDNHLYLGGYAYNNALGPGIRPILVKLDTALQPQFARHYGDPEPQVPASGYWVNHIVEDTDSNLILSAIDNAHPNSLILKVDPSNGQPIWELRKPIGNFDIGYINIEPLDSGRFLCLSSSGAIFPTIPYALPDMHSVLLSVFDSTGQILSQQVLADSGVSLVNNPILMPLKNGSYWVASSGMFDIQDLQRVSLIANFLAPNQAPTFIKMYEDSLIQSENSVLHDALELNGSIYHLGISDGGRVLPHPTAAKLWLLKTNRYGCVSVMDCPELSLDKLPYHSPQLSLYPNPAKQEIHLNGMGAKQGHRVRLYQTDGAMVYEQALAPGIHRFQLPAKLRSGFYVLYLEDQNGRLLFAERVRVE